MKSVASTPAPSSDASQIDLMRYVTGMERLVQAVQELSLAHDLADIQRIVRHAAREITMCDGATFVLRDGEHCYYADEDAIEPLWKGRRFPLEACISGWSMLNREAAVIPDIYADSRIPHEAYRPTFVKSLVMVPIRQLDPIGSIGNYWAHHRKPTVREVELLQALADSTSVAIAHVKILSELEQRVTERTAELSEANLRNEQLSITDDLTGLYNRRGLFVTGERLLEWGLRTNTAWLVAYLDVDGLKRVNDTYGHEQGDALLCDVAAILRETLRSPDIIARLGGDEFAILAGDPGSGATALHARLTDAINRFNRKAGARYKVAASIGIARADSMNGYDLTTSLQRADKLMYLQKTARREVA